MVECVKALYLWLSVIRFYIMVECDKALYLWLSVIRLYICG